MDKLVKIQILPNGQAVVSIPKDIIKAKKWKRGTELIFIEDPKTKRIMLIEKGAIL